MTARPGNSSSTALNRPESRTPDKAGVQASKGEASPFSVFAAHLSPITPSRAAHQGDEWQPPVVSPPYGAASMGGGPGSAGEKLNGGTQSGGKSSLRSSYETSATAFTCTLAAEQDPSTAGLSLPVSSESIEQAKAPSLAQRQAVASQKRKGAAANNPGSAPPAANQAAKYQVAEAAAKGVDKLPSATSPSQQKILPAEQESGPTSPFANLAGQQPPEDWGRPGKSSERVGKRKIQIAEDNPRHPKRMLNFPPSSKGGPQPVAAACAGMKPQPVALPAPSSQARASAAVPVAAKLPAASAGPSLQAKSAPAGFAFPGLSQALPGILYQPLGSLPGNFGTLPPGSLVSAAAGALSVPPAGTLLGVSSAAFPPQALPQGQPTSALAAAFAAGPTNRTPGVAAQDAAALAAAHAAPTAQRRQGPCSGAAASRRPQPNKRADREAAAAAGQKRCNCRRSRCLKLYCDCFAAGQFCTNCSCSECSNTPDCRDAVMEMREAIQSRNQNAFDTKVIESLETARGGFVNQHKRGCHCKRSHCKKKYCECFQVGVNCGQHCKCENCQNQAEHGPPEPLKKPSRPKCEGAARGTPVRDPGGESRRPPVRSRKKPPVSALAPDSDDALLLDTLAKPQVQYVEDIVLPAQPPPTPALFAWDPPLFLQGASLSLLDEKPQPSLLTPKEGLQSRPLSRATSAMPELAGVHQAREGGPAPLRSGSGTVLNAGQVAVGFPKAEVANVKGTGSMLTGSGPSTTRPDQAPEKAFHALEGIAVPPDDDTRFNVPHAIAMAPGSFLAALQSPELPGASVQSLPYGIEKELQAATEDIRSQAFGGGCGSFYGQPENFGGQQQDALNPPGPLLGPTDWTERRIEDIRTGQGAPFNLESILMHSAIPSPIFEEPGLLFGQELEPGNEESLGHDENMAPLPQAFANPGPQASSAQGIASKDAKARLRENARSPIRSPFRSSQSKMIKDEGGDERSPPGLQTAISLNPAGLPPIRRHRPNPEPLPATTLKRARSGEIFQDVIDSDLHSGYFQDQFLADELGGDALLALGGIDASAMVIGLGPPHKRLCHSSPLAADPVEPLAAGVHEDTNTGPTLRVAPVATRVGALSPSATLVVRPTATSKPSGNGFLRLTAGSTIFSPTKHC